MVEALRIMSMHDWPRTFSMVVLHAVLGALSNMSSSTAAAQQILPDLLPVDLIRRSTDPAMCIDR